MALTVHPLCRELDVGWQKRSAQRKGQHATLPMVPRLVQSSHRSPCILRLCQLLSERHGVNVLADGQTSISHPPPSPPPIPLSPWEKGSCHLLENLGRDLLKKVMQPHDQEHNQGHTFNG